MVAGSRPLGRHSLTPAEKAAGRTFRDTQQALLLASYRENPPDAVCPPFIRQYRHACEARGFRSVSLELEETYIPSPAYLAEEPRLGTWEVTKVRTENAREAVARAMEDAIIRCEIVPPARFGFIIKEGECKACGLTVRSKAGRLVDGIDRPAEGSHRG